MDCFSLSSFDRDGDGDGAPALKSEGAGEGEGEGGARTAKEEEWRGGVDAE